MARKTPADAATPEHLPPGSGRGISGRQRGRLLTYPVIPIRDTVYYPSTLFSLLIGRERSVQALEHALEGTSEVLLVSQRSVAVDEPTPQDLYDVGTVARVLQVLRVPDGTVRVTAEGMCRARVGGWRRARPFLEAMAKLVVEHDPRGVEVEALMRSVKTQFEHVVHVGRQIAPEALITALNVNEPSKLAFTILNYLTDLSVEARQAFLDTDDARQRLLDLSVMLKREAEVIEVQRRIRARVEKEIGDNQREIILREQLKAIHQELRERDDRGSEADEYRAKVQDADMPEDVLARALKEVERLERMPFGAPEGVVIRNYLDWLIALPWSKSSPDHVDISASAAVLDEDHHGLIKVKERILEFLAVRKLVGPDMKGPILCFVGPPGVGKTSIGRSVARALGRKFVRVSLGGVRDEAEIRGHRRTYVGALPGRIMQGMRQAETRNPVFMLDEIDKLGMDYRGDPSSALLEALDPEQNAEFSDHYIEVPFNLREVMFITTANVLDPVPPALRDRMEVITFAGYTEAEKLAIASGFLCPKQLREHGLGDRSITFPEATLTKLIREYTREAGVRNLEREIAAICRKTARAVASGDEPPATIEPDRLHDLLGHGRYRHGTASEHDEIGAATGLVYTETGGDVVTVEVTLLKSSELRLTLTGQLGDVMKESAQTAVTCVRSRAESLGARSDFDGMLDVHIHVPAGAVPKDGPSAGITMAVALASAATGRAVRRDVAMTGEMTLRGRVLPVGGIKEKLLGAHRAGVSTVIIPEENTPDLEEVPEHVVRDLNIRSVTSVDEALEVALTPLARDGA
ncbi:MAG: endopeptidase La [Chthonomonadales bacterium]|nr:endopeptidase La [Chthonomonadales bacterium]